MAAAGLFLWVALAVAAAVVVFHLRFRRAVGQFLKQVGGFASALAEGRHPGRLAATGTGELDDVVISLNAAASRFERLSADLAQEKSFRQAILDSMHDGVMVVDKDLTLVLVNRAVDGLMSQGGVGRAAGRPLSEFFPEPAVLEAFSATLKDGKSRQVTVEGIGDTRRTLQVTTAVLWDTDSPLRRQGVVALVRDMTEVRRLERVRSDFVANVSHELRTPLTSLQGFLETLLQEEVPEPTRQRFLEIMRRETQRMVNLVNDLLELSHLETGTEPLRREPVSLRVLAEQVGEAFAAELSGAEVSLEIHIPSDIPRVLADPRRVQQVLANLIGNAVKYMGEGGGKVTVEARAVREGRNRMVEVAVSDTGIGIAPEHLPRLFERFYRVDPARSRRQGGTGLGLAIVRHIVERHGGRVWAESQVGVGTVIRFTLPEAP